MNARITYLLSNEMEPDVRLSDAILFAALREALGEKIKPMESGRYRAPLDPLWGRDPYRGHGVGTWLLRELGDMADAAGCGLALEAFARPDREDGGLPGFYDRLGFKGEHGPSEDGYLEMVRAPQPGPDPEDHPEPDNRRIVADLIAGMAVFTAVLPLTAALRPYRNSYAPDYAHPSVVLTDLFADQPGQGAGSVYMAELARRCDAAGLTLYTDAQDDRSREFYLARGFERTTGRRDHQLVRWAPEPDNEELSS